jgi:phosphatidylglycerophosphatase A
LKLNANQIAKRVWQDPGYFIAFGFGSGLLPIAPGTWGTLAAIPLYLLISTLSLPLYLAVVLIAFVIGVLASAYVTRTLGEKDYGGIVWDEVVGYLLTMFMAPCGLFWIVAGFFLFRLFDIVKPPPIRWVDEQVAGGLGVMLDDVLAAVPAWLILQLLAYGFSK